ncbi:sodium-independent anion transporter, partial [Klebsiella pneumoniae]|nr:sodium-independent anion transporter [Klebsiella pneumoniae]
PELIGVPWLVYPLTALALGIVLLLPRLTTAVPSTLVAIVVVTALVMAAGWSVPRVGDRGELPDALPVLFLPDVPLTWET